MKTQDTTTQSQIAKVSAMIEEQALTREELLGYLRQIMEIRALENNIANLLSKAVLKGASHLYAGEEAVAVGAVAALRDDDLVTSTHRGHGHGHAHGDKYAKTPEAKQTHYNKMMAEVLGKSGGYCKGKGGSMHIADVEHGNLGATGIVGGNLPVAVGAALAQKLKGTDRVVVCFFGDGSTNTGNFHESLNMASIWNLPVVFVCENNMYGMSVPWAKVSHLPDVASRASAYGIPGEVVDGMDALAVRGAVSKAVARARKGEGPTLVEAKTYRYYGHSHSDPRAYRTREEEAEWKKRDPITVMKDNLELVKMLDEKEFEAMEAAVDEKLEKAMQYSEASAEPQVSEVDTDVYAPVKFTQADYEADRRLRELIRNNADMRQISYAQALTEAMREEMKRDANVFIMGEDKVKAFEVGGIDYITKPFQMDEVLARVQTHITLHQLQHQLQEANEKMKADVETLRQMEQTEREQRLLAESLRDIATTINCDLDLDKVLDMIIFGIGQVVEHDVVNITLVDENGIAEVVRQLGYDKYMNRGKIMEVKLSVHNTATLKRMIETGQPCIISNTNQSNDWIVPSGEEWIKSYMGAPILVRGKVVGFINLDSSIPDFYTPDKTENLLIFATQAGIAIENARLYTEAQRRLKELSILNQISLLISSTTNLDHVTELVYQQVNRLIDAQFFMLAEKDSDKDEWFSIYLKKSGKRLENFHVSTNDGFGGFVIRTRQPLYLPNETSIRNFMKQTNRNSIISVPRSIMVVPLVFSNKVIGVLGVQHDDKENAYSKDDFELFKSIGAQVAIWIENANLFAGMEKLAVTDTLTGIYNRRQLFSLAQQELERAFRYGRDFSLVIIDIDHFKKVNDIFGHPVGDEVLRTFTRLCVENLRIADIIGRYGGEEFLILMPETSIQKALEVAERLRKEIEAMQVHFDSGIVSITASLGAVSLHSIWKKENQKPSLDQLILLADEALYQAKTNGRNQVCGYSK